MQRKSVPNDVRTRKTKRALLKAARKLFVKRGFGNTGTPEIATEAGVTRGALYHHFADKTDLFRAVVEEEARKVASDIAADTYDTMDARAALIAGGEAYFTSMLVAGRAHLLLIEGPSVLGPQAMAEIDKRNGANALYEGLEVAKRQGLLADIPIGPLTTLLSAVFDSAALAIATGASAAEYKHVVQTIIASLLSRSAKKNK